MELKITTQQTLKVLHFLSWILFIGLCIEAGGYLFNAIYSTTVNSYAAKYFGLTHLFNFDPVYFVIQLGLMSIPAIMKALMFYWIVTIFTEKKLNIVQPFSAEIGQFLFKISYLSLAIGLFTFVAVRATTLFVFKGVQMPHLQDLGLAGADVWVFMGVILFVIAQIFRRGIELQSENELTI